MRKVSCFITFFHDCFFFFTFSERGQRDYIDLIKSVASNYALSKEPEGKRIRVGGCLYFVLLVRLIMIRWELICLKLYIRSVLAHDIVERDGYILG
jgi:hypothetical protein